MDLGGDRTGQRGERGQVRKRPGTGSIIDHAEAAEDFSSRGEQGVSGPGADVHRCDGGVVAGARIGCGVIDDERVPGETHQEVAEALTYRILPVGDLGDVDTDAGFPERPLAVDQGHESPSRAGDPRGQRGEILEHLLRTGVQQTGGIHRRQPGRVRQRRRQPVRPCPADEFHDSAHRLSPSP